MTNKIKLPKCDQCNSSTINGVYSHEFGCPNRDKIYNPESESWESVYECPECDSSYDNIESAQECCQAVEFEEDSEFEEEEETPLYDVFIRAWYKKDESGRIVPNDAEGLNDKKYIAQSVDFFHAREICRLYNDNNDAGELSIKAEFESQ